MHGDYVVQLSVNDGWLDSAPDHVTISTVNSRPVADAGTPQEANLGDLISLDGSGSSCLLYTSPSPLDRTRTRIPASA